VRLLDLELERLGVEIQGEVVLIADEVVDGGHVVAACFDQHPRPVQRLARDNRRVAVAPRGATARGGRLDPGGFCVFGWHVRGTPPGSSELSGFFKDWSPLRSIRRARLTRTSPRPYQAGTYVSVQDAICHRAVGRSPPGLWQQLWFDGGVVP